MKKLNTEKPFDVWVGRNPKNNQIDFIQMMHVNQIHVELDGCLHFEIESDEQRKRLAETFRLAAEALMAPVTKPISEDGVVQLIRYPDGSIGKKPDGS